MDMDWDQVATVAQLVTGAATLAVAVFLATQLRIQRQDSQRSHGDSEREILYAANRDIVNIFAKTMDPHFGPIAYKGGQDFDSLEGEERLQFLMLCYSYMMTQSVNFRAGNEGLDRGIESRLRAQSLGFWTIYPGIGTYYERYGRSHTFDPEMRAIIDSAFHDHFGREVETNWHFGSQQEARESWKRLQGEIS